MAPQRQIVAGVQPTGRKHLGNWFGAMQQQIALQHEAPGHCFFFVADYHALTTLHDAGRLQTAVADLARSYLALGLDPTRAALFRQSAVPAVCELAWLLGTVAGMGLLERAHAYKQKLAEGGRRQFGLFAYPVLMAADVLAFGATEVPVGRDQVQHIEIAQRLATAFGEAYGRGAPLLARPEARLSDTPYVVGTDGRKMSTSRGNTIELFAEHDELVRSVGRIVTEPRPLGAPLDPERCTVFALLALCLPANEVDPVADCYRRGARDGAPFGYADAKRLLVDAIERRFGAARARYAQLGRDPAAVHDVLLRSAVTARGVAAATLARCRRACGLDA